MVESLVHQVIVVDPLIINFPAYHLESCIIVYHGTAILTEPPKLYGDELIRILRDQMNLRIVEIHTKTIRLNGSDVLFTGNEFFIGIGCYTNLDGAHVVANSFPDFPCIPIDMPPECKLNLKHYVSVAGPGFLCANNSLVSKKILPKIQSITVYPYQVVTVPENNASNVLFVNNTLIHRSVSECYQSGAIINEYFRKMRNIDEYVPDKLIPMGFHAIGQMSCGFSAFCLLIRHPMYIREL